MSFGEDMIEAIQIFMKYDPEFYFSTGHDIIYGLPVDNGFEDDDGNFDAKPMITDQRDVDRLIELGWFMENDDYWRCFV